MKTPTRVLTENFPVLTEMCTKVCPVNFHMSSGQKSCRTKVSRIFRIFVPNFAPNFAPNFPRIFRGLFVLCFVGDGDQKKFTKNPRHFSMQNSQANTKKIFTKFFWRAGRVTCPISTCFVSWRKFPGPFFAGIVPTNPYCRCQFEGGQ